MMKCPKCQFEQPPDTYCASCGVNMETYRPAPKPMLKNILTHWMFHLSILIAVILGVVFYDRGHEKVSDEKTLQASQATQELSASASAALPSPEPEPVSVDENAPAPSLVSEKPTAPVAAKAAAPAGKNSIEITFYKATKNAIMELQKDSQMGNFSGEALGGIISDKKVAQLKASRELRSLGSNIFKDYSSQHPIIITKGQRQSTSGKIMGVFFQLTPIKQEPGYESLEIKSWASLKLQGNEENLFMSEMTISTQANAFIAGFLPKDKSFTDEEKAALNTDRTLKIYNDEEFWDGSVDVIMIIEMSQTP